MTFSTSFGVEFGLFTCADLIFRHPAELMVSRGVKNYVVPIAWSNEMAQMQAIPCLQGWSVGPAVSPSPRLPVSPSLRLSVSPSLACLLCCVLAGVHQILCPGLAEKRKTFKGVARGDDMGVAQRQSMPHLPALCLAVPRLFRRNPRSPRPAAPSPSPR